MAGLQSVVQVWSGYQILLPPFISGAMPTDSHCEKIDIVVEIVLLSEVLVRSFSATEHRA